MRKKLLVTAVSALLLVGAASSAAIAGEIKGPPGPRTAPT
jgi:hypothetical protein